MTPPGLELPLRGDLTATGGSVTRPNGRPWIVDRRCAGDGAITVEVTCPSGTRILLDLPQRLTLSYMKDAVTIRIDRELQRRLDRVCKQLGRSRSDVIRDSLRRQLALLQFEQARRQTMPFAEARGYLTDEDIYRDVS